MANSLKDMVNSVDWRKMLSDSDVRNAIIGTTLGGLVLGGAGLMQDRDPEESKFAPVGDALMGAVLGGVAGYGIPKGIALFRDAGGLAPDVDKLKPNNLGWGIGGALGGTGLFGISLYKTLSRTADDLRSQAERNLPAAQARARDAVRDARARNAPAARIEHLQRRADILDTSGVSGKASDTLAKLRRSRISALFHGDMSEFSRLGSEIDALKRYRNRNLNGYNTVWGDLLNRVADEPRGDATGRPLGLVKSLLRRDTWSKIRHPFAKTTGKVPHFFTHGRHYSTGNLFGIGPKVGPVGKVGGRGLLYGAGGAALALALHKLFGPSASDNFKK